MMSGQNSVLPDLRKSETAMAQNDPTRALWGSVFLQLLHKTCDHEASRGKADSPTYSQKEGGGTLAAMAETRKNLSAP